MKLPVALFLLFCVLLTAVVYCWYAKVQPTYTYSLTDPRLDAHQYTAQYDYFRGNTKNYVVRFPFSARILSSWLAAQLPFADIKTNFKVLNGVFLVLMSLFLTLLWQRLHIRNSLIVVGLCLLLFHWKGPVRMYLPDPVTADVGGYFFAALWLWILSGSFSNIIIKNRKVLIILLLCIVAALATLQKEVFIVVVGAMVIRYADAGLKKSHISYILAIACLAHFVADYFCDCL
jgi:hypothetical protein